MLWFGRLKLSWGAGARMGDGAVNVGAGWREARESELAECEDRLVMYYADGLALVAAGCKLFCLVKLQW